MTVLSIRLLEGKSLEAKDHSGTSDPFVTFKVVSNETGQIVSKGKSRVIKKSLNPQWNETLTLPTFENSNNLKNFTLLVTVLDWNRIGGKVPMGDARVPLEDLKPAQDKDVWVNLQNVATGSIHLVISNKIENKYRVLISYGNDPVFEYDLFRDVRLASQMDVLCQVAKAVGKHDSYALQLKDTEQYITEQMLADPKFVIPHNAHVKLVIRPNLQVQAVLEALKNDTTKKKAIFDLKKQLEDSAFAQAFLAADGIKAITSLIIEDTGNTLAYALASLDSSMTYGFGWDNVSQQVIDKIVSLMDSPNLNVTSGALRIAVHLAGSKNHGYPALSGAIKKINEKNPNTFNLYARLISSLASTDVKIQLSVLQFLNNMLMSAPDIEKDPLVATFEKHQLTKVLKDSLGTADPELKKEIYKYLKLKYGLDTNPQPYDKQNKQHEDMLMLLWNTIFPDKKLESRVSEQWKTMGFQGTDPATDFRGMGTLGLKHLLYAAKQYTKTLRNMMESQEANPETYYPVAVAGINISNMLFSLFRDAVSEEQANEKDQRKFLQILFDHDHALEEVYCTSLQYFDRIWDELEATYFNFSSVMNQVTEQIVENLSQCTTLRQFFEKSLKDEGKSMKKLKEKEGSKKKLQNKSSSSSGTTAFIKRMSGRGDKKHSAGKIHEAVKAGDTKKVSDLLREGVSVNEITESGVSPLHVAVLGGNLELIRLLLWKDADVSLKNDSGWTPLHEACKSSSLEVIEILMHKGADPNAETTDGALPLHYLVSRKFDNTQHQQQIMSQMLLQGVDINHHKNHNQETPLHYAVQRGLTDAAKFLLENNAEINAKNSRGYTALHMAILQGHGELVTILLEAGADTTISCKEGTCAELAKHNPKIAEMYNNFINRVGKSPTLQAKMQEQHLKQQQRMSRPLPVTPSRSPITQENHYSNSTYAVPASLIRGQQQQQQPQNPEVVSVPAYHGNLAREIAENLVSTQGGSAFLIRDSSVSGCFAMTMYSATEKEITHYLVYPRTSGGYSIQDCDDTNTYPNLKELIAKTPILKGCAPVPSSSKIKAYLNELNNAVQNALKNVSGTDSNWKQDLKKAMTNLDNVL